MPLATASRSTGLRRRWPINMSSGARHAPALHSQGFGRWSGLGTCTLVLLGLCKLAHGLAVSNGCGIPLTAERPDWTERTAGVVLRACGLYIAVQRQPSPLETMPSDFDEQISS